MVATTEAPPRVGLISLGCTKNLVDAEGLLGRLGEAGFAISESPDAADVVIVNTCAFVEEAREESIDAILDALEAKERGRVQGVVVTGCMAQRYGSELLEELPELDGVIAFAAYPDLPGVIRRLVRDGERGGVQVGPATLPFHAEKGRLRLTPDHYTYLRVAEGCDHGCSFCAIPIFRGGFRSKPWEGVLEEAAELVGSGAREICLIAEDTNQWGQDVPGEDRRLADLLRALGELESDGLRWLRILYAYPAYFDDELIRAIAETTAVVPYIDIPLQHIADPVLRRMRRPPREATVELLERLRAEIPDLTLRTTFICGLPGETEEDFAELLDFVRSFRFERMGAFAYSEEEGTPAADMADQVPVPLREERRDRLMEAQQEIAFERNEARVGREVEVLVDEVVTCHRVVGRTPGDAPNIDQSVVVKTDGDLEPGDFARVALEEARGYDLVGRSLGPA